MEARRRRRLLDFKKPTGAETSYKLHLKKVELYQGELLMDSDPTQYSSEESGNGNGKKTDFVINSIDCIVRIRSQIGPEGQSNSVSRESVFAS